MKLEPTLKAITYDEIMSIALSLKEWQRKQLAAILIASTLNKIPRQELAAILGQSAGRK